MIIHCDFTRLLVANGLQCWTPELRFLAIGYDGRMAQGMVSRRRLLLGGAAGAVLTASGCAHRTPTAPRPARLPPGPTRVTKSVLAPSAEPLPQYTALLALPGPQVSDDVSAAEGSPLFHTQVERAMDALQQPPRRPTDDKPLLIAFVAERGPLTFGGPDGQRCVPVFTSPVAAADYQRLLLHDVPPLHVLVSNARQFVRFMGDVQPVVSQVAIDRCPRCPTVATVSVSVVRAPDDAIRLWSMFAATKMTRLELYVRLAEKAYAAGQLERARDLALATVAHVMADDPQPHRLLSEVAAKLGDTQLRGEAERYLAYLQRHGIG
jgi:hypothetical protein